MVFHKPDDDLPGMLYYSPGEIDDTEAYRLHPPRGPGFTEGKPLHGRVEVEGEHGYPPPCGILSKPSRGKPPSRKVLLQYGMGLLALAAALMREGDETVPRPVLGGPEGEVASDAPGDTESNGEVEVQGKSREGGHACRSLFFFVLVREDALCHTVFTIVGDGFWCANLFYHPDYSGPTGFLHYFGGGSGRAP